MSGADEERRRIIEEERRRQQERDRRGKEPKPYSNEPNKGVGPNKDKRSRN